MLIRCSPDASPHKWEKAKNLRQVTASKAKPQLIPLDVPSCTIYYFGVVFLIPKVFTFQTENDYACILLLLLVSSDIRVCVHITPAL